MLECLLKHSSFACSLDTLAQRVGNYQLETLQSALQVALTQLWLWAKPHIDVLLERLFQKRADVFQNPARPERRLVQSHVWAATCRRP